MVIKEKKKEKDAERKRKKTCAVEFNEVSTVFKDLVGSRWGADRMTINAL